MEFTINNDIWKIEEKDKETLLKTYNPENNEDCSYVFGMTSYPKHEIWINKEMCKEQKIKTLKHELTHCYIWEYGLYYAPHFTDEMVCDLVASSNDFINEVIEQYKNSK